MKDEELCLKCKSYYLKPTAEDPRKRICNFCGNSQLNLTLEDIRRMHED
jgi:hypothetical protein